MRSQHITLRIPQPVYAGGVRRQLELPYETYSQYVTNLQRCDLILQRDHDFTRWMAVQTLADQDAIDDCLSVFQRSVPGSQPTLTHHFCNGIILVMMTRHGCSTKKALCYLPACVQALCASCGFS